MKAKKITQDEFISRNLELNFLDELSAKRFYQCISIDNLPPANMILIDAIKTKFNWYDANKLIHSLILNPISDYTKNKIDLNKLLDYRIDDYLVNVGQYYDFGESLNGSYLLNDLFYKDEVNNQFLLYSKEDFTFKILTDLIREKDKYLMKHIKILKSNFNNTDTNYIGYLLILFNFINDIKANTNENNELLRNLNFLTLNNLVTSQLNNLYSQIDYLFMLLNIFFNDLNYEYINFSRLSIMKISDIFDYQNFIKTVTRKNNYNLEVFNLLDIFV
ncbi:MAG: hypothetical protein [Bacteriophage sp.]|nr:MAG: hypothetical protein [Bacteriophage sp.]